MLDHLSLLCNFFHYCYPEKKVRQGSDIVWYLHGSSVTATLALYCDKLPFLVLVRQNGSYSGTHDDWVQLWRKYYLILAGQRLSSEGAGVGVVEQR